MFVYLCNETRNEMFDPRGLYPRHFRFPGLIYIAACPWVSNGNAKQRIPTPIHRAALT